MKIIVDRENKIRFGEKMLPKIQLGRGKFPLHPSPGKRSGYDFFCESYSHVAFAQIEGLSGSDLPDRISIQTQARDRCYPYVRGVTVCRDGRRVHIGVDCSYDYGAWIEVVQLKDFYPLFVRLLKRVQRVSVYTEDEPDSTFMYVDTWGAFPSTERLASNYSKILELLVSKHTKTVNKLTPAVRRAALAGKRKARGGHERPAAFICHDSRDKERVARPIADGLSKLMCPVWFDELSLGVGDHLRESIEKGLQEARRCILIISPRFLANKGWTKVEFNSVFSRELIQRRNIILPVWVGVTKERVLAYSPSLANRVALNWRLGVNEVVRQLYCAIDDRASR